MLTEHMREKYSEIALMQERNTLDPDTKRKSDFALIDYMKEILSDEPDDMTACFCHWNISDGYALRRDFKNEYNNHLVFVGRLSRMDERYLFWCVCDATQKFTLELGGYGDFWWDNYLNAVAENKSLDNNERVAYLSHRAAMAAHPALAQSSQNFKLARREFAGFLDKTKDSPMSQLYKTVYAAGCLELFGECEFDLTELCGEMLSLLKDDTLSAVSFVCGEWEYLDRVRTKNEQACIAICAAVNALIKIGNVSGAKEIYFSALEYGMKNNAYIEKRLN